MEGVTPAAARRWDDYYPGGQWLYLSGDQAGEKLYRQADVHAALARQAEAMQREMADLREVRANGRDAAGALHDALMAERTANAELREALKPFAAVADVYDGTAVEDSDPILSTDGPRLTAGDVRRARALIGGGNAEE